MWHEGYELLIAGLGAVIAIIIAVFAIISANSARTQTNILKSEFESSHRPWIGSSGGIGFTVFFENSLVARIDYKNYGNLPALSIIEKIGITMNDVTRETIKDDTDFKKSGNSVLLPSQVQGVSNTIPEEIKHRILDDGEAVYLWATIDFDFLNNKKGQYGIIVTYRKDGHYEIIDEWTR